MTWPTRARRAGRSAFATTSSTTRASSRATSSSRLLPITKPGERRTRASHATAISSLGHCSTAPESWAATTSQPAITPGWNAWAGQMRLPHTAPHIACSRASTPPRIRATSSTASPRSASPTCSSRWAGSSNRRRFAPLPRRRGSRLPTRRTPKASASFRKATTCDLLRSRPVGSRQTATFSTPRETCSAAITGRCATRSDSARALAWRAIGRCMCAGSTPRQTP